MTSGNVLADVRKGMQVTTADGTSLGTIAHVWFGADPASNDQRCDEESCSRLEVHLPRRGGTYYIPYNAIHSVSGKSVTLNLTEGEVNDKLWHQRPLWLPPDASNDDFDHMFRPHTDHGSY